MAAGLSVLEAALESLTLLGEAPPWDLGQARPPRRFALDPVLIAPTPLPYALEPELVLASFLPSDRANMEAQIDAAYEHLEVLDVPHPGRDPDHILVQLSLPLVGADRALLRIRTWNAYGADPADVDWVCGDHHAFLDLDGRPISTPDNVPSEFSRAWPEWIAGRSPGLNARLDLNSADEYAFRCLPVKVSRAQAKAIVRARPFESASELAEVRGIGPVTLAALEPYVGVDV